MRQESDWHVYNIALILTTRHVQILAPPLPCSALRLDKLPEYRGTLGFVMNVDGVERNFSFAVKVYMTVNSPSRNRHSDIAVAVIVLKAEQAASVVNR